VAVDHVTFDVQPGSFVGLIGPNGAGKTSLIDAVTGFTPSSGRITFAGSDIHSIASHRRAQRGISRTFQTLELLEDLTVRENIVIGVERDTWWTPIVDSFIPRGPTRDLSVIEESLELLGIVDTAERYPIDLTLGQRKLVTVACALAARPSLMILDEPASGLDSGHTLELGATLRSVVDSGTTILLVDHDMGLVLSVCDMIHVLEFGKLIASGTSAEIRQNAVVTNAYLGSRAAGAVA
jgi:ABC-type branched-subunit amino acid transport system ATPase component